MTNKIPATITRRKKKCEREKSNKSNSNFKVN